MKWFVVLLPLLVACGGTSADRTSGAGTSGGGTSGASCVGPYLDDQPSGGPFGAPSPTLSPGDTLTIHGHWYTETCNDTGGDDPLVPMSPVRLTVRLPGGEQLDLGSFSPSGDDMGFAATVRVPDSTPAGKARVRDDGGHAYMFEVAGG